MCKFPWLAKCQNEHLIQVVSHISSLFFFHLDIGQFILNLKSGAVGRWNTIFSLTTNLLSEKTVFTEIRWMILKIGSDFYNSLFYIQIRKKYSRKVSWNNFEVKEIFQKTHKLKMFAFWSLWAARAMQTLSNINWRNWRSLNSHCNSMYTRKFILWFLTKLYS